MTDVETQVGNSCVANAFVGAYEYLAKRDLGTAGDVIPIRDENARYQNPWLSPSPLPRGGIGGSS